jgi:hypothetical protein
MDSRARESLDVMWHQLFIRHYRLYVMVYSYLMRYKGLSKLHFAVLKGRFLSTFI